jgi:hypothetical protein
MDDEDEVDADDKEEDDEEDEEEEVNVDDNFGEEGDASFAVKIFAACVAFVLARRGSILERTLRIEAGFDAVWY